MRHGIFVSLTEPELNKAQRAACPGREVVFDKLQPEGCLSFLKSD